MKVAILQSNYLPWKGVFDMINQVDGFVFFDDVDFTRRDWRTRNKIRTAHGDKWLSVPVKKCSRGTKICEVEIAPFNDWRKEHLMTICHAYKKSKYFDDFKWILDDIYINNEFTKLSDLNIFITKTISKVLGIKTKFYNALDLNVNGSKDDRLIAICKSLGANHYLSGPSAASYIDINKFKKQKIELEYIQYRYPQYNQLQGEFNHFLSVIDVIFCTGKDASKYIFNDL